MKKMMWVVVMIMVPTMAMAAAQTLQLKIDGMTCDSCAAKVKKTLASVCKEITVDQKAGAGVCTYEAPVTADQVLIEAKKTGFTITPKK